MFLSEPSETPFDLKFWLFGVHVRVHPFFWLATVILGWEGGGGDGRLQLVHLGLWVACVFVSILVHEFGHVVAGRMFGSHGHIVLHSFGGLAVGSNALNRRWQRILVLFAGPLAGFILFGIVILGAVLLLPKAPPAWRDNAETLVDMLIFINLYWGLINLLPVWPLDGGQISRELFTAVAGDNGGQMSLVLSVCVSGALAVGSLLAAYGHPIIPFLPGDIYIALMFGYLCLLGFQGLQVESQRRRRYSDDDFPWER